MTVTRHSVGAGNRTTGSSASLGTSWSHTVATGTRILVFVGVSVSTNSSSTTCSVTIGGTAMTQLVFLPYGSSTNRGAIGIYHLDNNDLAGAQTVSVTTGGASTKTAVAGQSIAIGGAINVANDSALTAALARTLTTVVGGYAAVVTNNGAAITSPTQTQQLLSGSSVGGVGDYTLVQDALAAATSVAFSASGTATTPQTLGFTATPSPLISTLTDDFATLDTAKWTFSGGATVTGGQAVIPSNTVGDLFYANSRYDLVGGELSAKIPQTMNTSDGTPHSSMMLAHGPATKERLLFDKAGATLNAWQNINDTYTNRGSVTYSAVDHLYWRIRETGGTVYWETSANGTSWSTLGSAASSLFPWIGDGAIYFQAYHGAGAPSPGSMIIDDVNILPAAAAPSLVPLVRRPNYGSLLQL